MKHTLNTIPEAILEIQKGNLVIVVDDENRENEGDFVAAAEKVTPEMINFMATNGRGLICVPLLEKRCEELNLDLMVGKNTDPMKTQFTISVDKIGDGCTTGISAHDRYKTVKALADSKTKIEEGKLLVGTITKISEKHVFLLIDGMKSEALIDINEAKSAFEKWLPFTKGD